MFTGIDEMFAMDMETEFVNIAVFNLRKKNRYLDIDSAWIEYSPGSGILAAVMIPAVDHGRKKILTYLIMSGMAVFYPIAYPAEPFAGYVPKTDEEIEREQENINMRTVGFFI